jgi:hypothetical protein
VQEADQLEPHSLRDFEHVEAAGQRSGGSRFTS